jgi:surfactin synthase thioesterase subunit
MIRVDSDYIHLNGRMGVRLYGASNPVVRLLCFSPIGGHSIHFSQLARHLPQSWQLCAVDPPGHGQAKGHLMVNFDSLISLYLDYLESWFKGEFYIFGHSLGGLIGYALTQKLEKEVNLAGIFISSTIPPHRVTEDIGNFSGDDITDSQILDYLKNVDSRYQRLANSLFFLYVKPIFKADYKVYRSFSFSQIKKIETPLYIIYSPNDMMVNSREVKEWSDFGASVQFIEVPGKHDNIVTHPEIIMKKIETCIASQTGQA